jgi:hypothetical protein
MSTKYLKGECSHCGGRVEFPAEAVGIAVDCPHCGKSTELLLAVPKEEPAIPRSVIIWTLVAVLVLAGGLAGALYALKRAQRWADRKKEQAAMLQVAPTTTNVAETTSAADEVVSKAEFRVSEIKIEKTKGSSLMYAMGVLTNASARIRYGVKLELELLNAEGKKVGKASDYQPMIEPNSKWEFRALVVEGKAASARVAAVTEQQ